ncbi:tRNA guanosine(34) transglycosylase Tgt [Sphaerobacter sp.]|uniref:tRNA guanosine(34) transglycosylase Tgt n=1 Tax=Sphaerobacter sp. TaxID=2099654 RepID=UPI0025EADD5C|nr:tRNA guanosine(34) transglycosylase Tgt [Sphaerobacter sp.]
MERDNAAPHSGGEQPHHFEILAADPATRARVGILRTRRGDVRTPAFMPVGTQASVKSLTPDEVRATGTDIILANTYHLMLRPGVAVLEAAGGVQRFMAWDGPVLTDSGGFQVFSLAQRREVREEGVTFRSHLDGSRWELTPESAIDLQLGFGSDIIMPLDELVGYGSDDAAQAAAMERTHRWLLRAIERFAARQADVAPASRPMLFGIAQGGFDPDRRRESASFLRDLPLDGSAIGGLSVGEPKEVMAEMLDASVDGLPPERPRYLMGVGSPEDLWRGVAAGVDMFDCVHPTRVARRGALFTPDGRIDVTASRFRTHFGPVDETCTCPTCTTFSAAYLHHLFRARELLAYRLGTIHNLWFIQREMARIRDAIARGTFAEEMRAFLDRYRPADSAAAALQRQRHRVVGAEAGMGRG